MTHKTTQQFDEISHLLKKIEWPSPDRTLGQRIIGEMMAFNMPEAVQISEQQASIWLYKSPVVTMMAVILSLFLGVASGLATSSNADATEMEITSPYGATTSSIANIYLGQTSGYNQ